MYAIENSNKPAFETNWRHQKIPISANGHRGIFFSAKSEVKPSGIAASAS